MSESEDSINKLKINEEFAEKFKHNEKRKKVEKLKSKFGKNFRIKEENESDENDSNESEEDSDGELDNEIIRDKFINTLLELKDSKESKKLLEEKKPIFTDEDFKEKREKEKKNDEKIYTIKDNLLNNEENDDENNIYSINYKPKKIEEDKTEKNAFLKKVNEQFKEENSSNEKDFFDNGLLKKKSVQTNFINISNENNNNSNENNENKIESLTLSEILKKSKIPTKNLNMSLLKKIWGDEKISNDEKFLRNYILSEGWIEKENFSLSKNLLLIDKEDEENEDRFDKFEKEKNFRFEEENGANIITFDRNVNSYRHDDKRALKRKEHDERKKEEILKKKNDIKKERKEKAEKLKEKINELEKIAGTEKINEIYEEFYNENEDDFDMNEFDRRMNEIFDEEFEKKAKEEDAQLLKNDDEKSDEKSDEKNDENNENNENDDENNEKENEKENLWFFCDNCKKPIEIGRIKYDCKTCDDFTLCQKCYKTIKHSHIMKKTKVSNENSPPENAQEIINNFLLENNLTCSKCKKEIIENYYFICNECKNIKFCKNCRSIGKSIHEHKLHKFNIENNENNENDENNLNAKEKLLNKIDTKANYEIDNIIDGEIPTKFHYKKVEKENFGLSDDMLILLDDKILNKYLPIKKLATYNNDFYIPEYKKKFMKKHLEKLVNKKKREIFEEFENKNNNIKNNEKLLEKKIKRNKNFNNENNNNNKEYLNKDEFKKKKRLETYEIN